MPAPPPPADLRGALDAGRALAVQQHRPDLARHTPILASAFHVAGIPYRWERGVVEPLTGAAA